MSKVLAAYIRVSTQEQAQEGYSIDAQSKMLQAWSVVKGYDECKLYIDDGYSGKNLKRPAVQRLIEDCKAHRVDGVVVWKYDRISRDLRDMLTLVDDIFLANKIQFISTSEQIDTSTAMGRLILNILGAVAQNEREVTQQRVKMVMESMAKECRHMGGKPPYGYMVVDGHLEIDPVTSVAVRQIFDMHNGGYGYTDILAWLNGHGYKTTYGNDFTKVTVHDILRNEKYKGTFVYNRTLAADRTGKRSNKSKPDDEIIRIPGGIPAIVDPDDWEMAQKVTAQNRLRPGAFTAKANYILSGLCRCSVCGRSVTGVRRGKDRNGTPQYYYGCPNKCIKYYRKEKLESMVIDFLIEFCTNEAMIRASVDVANKIIRECNEAENEERKAIKKRLQQIHIQQANIIEAVKAGASTPSMLKTLTEIDKEEAELNQELQRTDYKEVSADELIEMFSVYKELKNEQPDVQRSILRLLIDRIDMGDDEVTVTLSTGVVGGGDAHHTTPVIKFYVDARSKALLHITFLIMYQGKGTEVPQISSYMAIV